MSELRAICKENGSVKVNNRLYLWDYAQDRAVPAYEMPPESKRKRESDKAKAHEASHKMKGTWVREGEEILYMINDDYAAISMLTPDPEDDTDDEYQLSIGYASNIKKQYYLTGDLSNVKKVAGVIADEYLSNHEIPTPHN